jgi:hypothetical protein
LEYEVSELYFFTSYYYSQIVPEFTKTLRRMVLVKISLWQYNCRHCIVEMDNDTLEIDFQSMPQRNRGKIKALIIEEEMDIC